MNLPCLERTSGQCISANALSPRMSPLKSDEAAGVPLNDLCCAPQLLLHLRRLKLKRHSRGLHEAGARPAGEDAAHHLVERLVLAEPSLLPRHGGRGVGVARRAWARLGVALWPRTMQPSSFCVSRSCEQRARSTLNRPSSRCSAVAASAAASSASLLASTTGSTVTRSMSPPFLRKQKSSTTHHNLVDEREYVKRSTTLLTASSARACSRRSAPPG